MANHEHHVHLVLEKLQEVRTLCQVGKMWIPSI
jgi:hypothetical protein